MTREVATLFGIGFVIGGLGFTMALWAFYTDGMDAASRARLRNRLLFGVIVAAILAASIGMSADVIMPLPDCDRILREEGWLIWFMLGCWAL